VDGIGKLILRATVGGYFVGHADAAVSRAMEYVGAAD
jgi:hypothetical protein